MLLNYQNIVQILALALETDVLLRVHLCEHLMDPLLPHLHPLPCKSEFGGLDLSITAHFRALALPPFLAKTTLLNISWGTLPQFHCVERGEWHAMTTDGGARRRPLGDSLSF